MSERIFHPVARLTDLLEGRSLRVRIGDEEIALWRVDGRIYAVSNVCPHQHSPVLHQATRKGLLITCPMHGWTFSLETGQAVNGNGSMRTYPVRVEGNRIMVEEPGPAW